MTIPTPADEAKDDPEMDCTDFAHPAWWRGHDHACDAVVRRMENALDGTDNGAGVLGSAAMEKLRRKLMALSQQSAEIARLERELASVKSGYNQLDRNWHAVHEGAMTPIREALGLPEGTVLELVERIAALAAKGEAEANLKLRTEERDVYVNAHRELQAITKEFFAALHRLIPGDEQAFAKIEAAVNRMEKAERERDALKAKLRAVEGALRELLGDGEGFHRSVHVSELRGWIEILVPQEAAK